jgi:hypothetical protein
LMPESDHASQRVLRDPDVRGGPSDRIVEITAPIKMTWGSALRDGAHGKQGI